MPMLSDLTLAPGLEERVRAVADRHGLSPSEALSGLLETILRAEENALPRSEQERAELMDALFCSEDNLQAGRWLSLESLQGRHENRPGQPGTL